MISHEISTRNRNRCGVGLLPGPAPRTRIRNFDLVFRAHRDGQSAGTAARGGATYREAHLTMEILADHGRMLSFEIVEVNLVIDEHNRTADLAVELACSAFGKKIL
jgi:hypothetical protein